MIVIIVGPFGTIFRNFCIPKKNSQQNFPGLGYMLSFEGGTLLFRETVTLLTSRNVIHRRPALFWCMIHVSVSAIIPVLKKKTLLFFSSSFNIISPYLFPNPVKSKLIYIYIYMCVCVCVCVCVCKRWTYFGLLRTLSYKQYTNTSTYPTKKRSFHFWLD